MIDSHGHLNFTGFADSYPEVIERARAAGVTAIVMPSTQIASSEQAIKLANEYPGFLFPTVGQHPTHVLKHEFNVEDYRKLAVNPAVIAIGEIGLDAHRDEAKATLAEQKIMLQAQLDLAVELNKPVIMHCRNAYEELLTMLKAMPKRPRGVLHCFAPVSGAGYTGSVTPLALANTFLELGYLISFAGIITYPKNDTLREVAAAMPLDRMLVETDAPFLSPQAHRGQPNEPAFIVETIVEIARQRGVDAGVIAEATANNAKRLFSLTLA